MASKAKKHREELKQEDILQAVVIADSFNVRFTPLTQEKPRVLLPLVNTPLLDYTLDFLCSAGIDEVFVFCCHHADLIKSHIKASKWSKDSSTCQVTVIVSEDVMSVGDCLRDIDAKDLITSDFVLITGDVVSNMDLGAIIEKHKERREKEKFCIMTMVMKRALPGHRSRCGETDPVLAIDVDGGRILHYQNTQGAGKRLEFPTHVFLERGQVALHYDLMDCELSICSPTVAQLFTDNFDYQTRDDFVRGILINQDIMGNMIYLHRADDTYASRVTNLSMYDVVSKDILSRWTYPLVPDLTEKGSYSYGRHNIYLHQENVTLARGCELSQNVVIGEGSTVGMDTHIANSVIGRNCKIGKDVKIEGAYLWDGVVVGDGCIVARCILADAVQLCERVTIEAGCVVSYGCVVGPHRVVPAGTLLSLTPIWDFTLDTADEEAEEDDDDDDASSFASSLDDDDGDGGGGRDDVDGRDSPPADDARQFYAEVLDSLQRGVDEDVRADNLVLEVNSSKYAYNVTMRELNTLVTRAVLEMPHIRAGGDDDAAALTPPQLMLQLKPLLVKFAPILSNYFKSADSQLDCLNALEEYSLGCSSTAAVLAKVLHYLYNEEILGEQVIMQWYTKCQHADLKSQVQPFITWLQEAEEESGSDEESE
ncbi:PREDICTED: translation initiation factor eIF-2B subunit epsilon-like [Priapulus caudatus]|uniref:Translation initiation factor eIF2B subunit epsilon n=1 Tax=Priapulus caudatus TaxID=37621 RepID=A0ABM1E783_PRICU|nr:PREDICTED: translation initiation factor eIF-2B subunit epsilon-like [Priapulus caudatus]